MTKHFSGTLPWTRHCLVCGQDNPDGFQLRSRVEGDRVVLQYTTQATDVGYRHIVHGGILMTLLDEVMTWSAILATGKICVAAELTTRLKKPVSAGEMLRIEGRMARHTKRLILTEGVVRDAGGHVLVEASGKYVPMPADKATLRAEDFVPSPDTISPHEILGQARP